MMFKLALLSKFKCKLLKVSNFQVCTIPIWPERIVTADSIGKTVTSREQPKSTPAQGSKQLPKPEVIQPTPETINEPTHPGPPSPNLLYDPKIIPSNPSDQTQDPLIDIDDEPENNTPAPQSPRKSHYNFRKNPTSNWKPDYAYYNALTTNSTNLAHSSDGLDNGPELQFLADLGPDGSPRSGN